MKRLAIVMLAVLAVGAAGATQAQDHGPQRLACQEDEVIMGTGDFHGPARGWDGYVCIPADDL